MMQHTPAERIEWVRAPDENFTGRVWFGPLSHASEKGLKAAGVHFDPAARTDWHSHPDGQVLYVVSGAGLVQTEAGETVEISAGDIVYAPVGELHWHGAGPTTPMMHLSLTTGGETQWQPRKVTDQEYERR